MASPTAPASQSRLLLLPRELRDIIYEYVLTEPGGLVADVTSSLTTWTRFRAANNHEDHRCESNQLRYVCRQLHAETSALSLRYNDLTFRCRADGVCTTVYNLLDQFYHNCSSVNLKAIRRITFLDSETSLPEEKVHLPRLLSPSLVRFCQGHAKATVIVRFSWIVSKFHREQIDCMILLSEALGRRRPFHYQSVQGQVFGTNARKLQAHFTEVICLNNLGFSFPYFFDEDSAWMRFDYLGFPEYGNDGVNIGYDGWVDIAKAVHENGI